MGDGSDGEPLHARECARRSKMKAQTGDLKIELKASLRMVGSPPSCLRTVVVHSRHALRHYRTAAAFDSEQGLRILTLDLLAARLAGGFLAPINTKRLNEAMSKAIDRPFGELEKTKKLPGFRRAASASLFKAWMIGLDLKKEAANATEPTARKRLDSMAKLEKNVLSLLQIGILRPSDLAEAAVKRVRHVRPIFGRIEIRGQTEPPPVYRHLLTEIAQHTDVIWNWKGEARTIPIWLSGTKIQLERSPPTNPKIVSYSCSDPQHEILEAFRWARQHMSLGVPPQNLAIVTASPELWDDHVSAMSKTSDIPIHFIHGRKAIEKREGQLAAALAEVLLRGFSRKRVRRLVELLRIQCERFKELPRNWWRQPLSDAPLLSGSSWLTAIDRMNVGISDNESDFRPLLKEIINKASKGIMEAEQIGESLLEKRALGIWRRSLTEGPEAALDVTLRGVRIDDDIEPEAALVWGPAAAIAAAPRPYIWLAGLSSRFWPRRANTDPLLPEHIIETNRLEPFPVHETDQRDFRSILDMAEKQVICSRPRLDSLGRKNGISPLFPDPKGGKSLAQCNVTTRAASESDRLMARLEEFERMPQAVSALQTWNDWNRKEITGHDGRIRKHHPLLKRALDRTQTANSLVILVRNPLKFLWTYGFGWSQPEEVEEFLTLDPKAFGRLLHEILEETIKLLEGNGEPGFAEASTDEIRNCIGRAAEEIDKIWESEHPIPPPVIWRLTLNLTKECASTALCLNEEPLEGQSSWAEVHFGQEKKQEHFHQKTKEALPWDPFQPVSIPDTSIRIRGSIDRLDLSEDGKKARVTDYKSGSLPGGDPQINGGKELQRCVYAFAVKGLIETNPTVDTRLHYLRNNKILPLKNLNDTLTKITKYLKIASGLFNEGKTLPGPDAGETWCEMTFALPGRAKKIYLDAKRSQIDQELDSLKPLWSEP